MIQLKFVLGLVELMAVFKFLSNADLVWGWGVINRTVVLSVWALLVLSMALVMLGLVAVPGLSVIRKRFPNWAFFVIFLGFALYLGQGVTGKPLNGWTESYLPPELNPQTRNPRDFSPASAKSGDENYEDLQWYDDLAVALIQAKQEQKPIFIDLTGYTCVNCRWMEKTTFVESGVYERLKNRFVKVRLYTDGGEGYQENQKLQIERFKTIALPFYVILSPNNVVLAKRAGIASPPEFRKFLDQVRPD